MYFTNEELDLYINKVKGDHSQYVKNVVPRIIESLRKNPNNYLAFGVYWYHVKKVIQELSSGDDWFYGDFHDQLIMEMSDHGDDFRNVVAALVYADSTDYFSSSSHTYTWKGDPRGYILEDDNFLFKEDIEKAVATESVKRSAGGLKQLESKLEKKHNVKLDIFQSNAGIEFTKLIVPKEERDKGIGSKVMKAVIAFADKKGLVIGLTPSKDFGGTLGRLKSFYKRFGFVDNKGRNKDYSFRASMIRNPKGEIAMEAVQIDFNSALGKPIGVLNEQVERFDTELQKDLEKRRRKAVYYEKPIAYDTTGLSKPELKDLNKQLEYLNSLPNVEDINLRTQENIYKYDKNKAVSYIQKLRKEGGKGSLNQERVSALRAIVDFTNDKIYAESSEEKKPAPIKIEGKLNQGLKDYFTANGIPEVGTQFENNDRLITLKEIIPRGDVSDVKMSYQVKGVDKEFPLTDIPVKG